MNHRRLVQLVVFVFLTIFCAAAWAADMGRSAPLRPKPER